MLGKMGSLIDFPGRKKTRKMRAGQFFVEMLPNSDQHEDTQDIAFTCAMCKHRNEFLFSGVIFRECHFYCAGCGAGYKLDNPLFTNLHRSKTK
jgi:hypothetical protein